MKNQEPNERLKIARESAGFTSSSDAARSIGVKVPTYNHHENGTRDFDRIQAITYARRFKVSASWLMFGGVQSPNEAERIEKQIPEVDVRAGAGVGGDGQLVQTVENGVVVSTDAVRDYWNLPDSFLTGDLGMRQEHARIIEVQGDSMYDPNNPGAQGSIFPGERLIIDTSDKRPTPSGPFAIWDGVGIAIKMVEFLQGSEPPKIRMTSRNSAYSAFEATMDEVQIIGRVKGKISAL